MDDDETYLTDGDEAILAIVGLPDDAQYSEIFDAIATAPESLRDDLRRIGYRRLEFYDMMQSYEFSDDGEES